MSLEDFTVRAFAAWHVGRKSLDDGLVLFVFSEDRKVRIEVGYGLESQVPDAVASRIIRETIVPRIQAGDREVVRAGITALLTAVGGEAPPGAAATPRADDTPPAGAGPSLSLGQKLLIGLAIVELLNPSSPRTRPWRSTCSSASSRAAEAVVKGVAGSPVVAADPAGEALRGHGKGTMRPGYIDVEGPLAGGIDAGRIEEAIRRAERRTSGEIRVSVSRFFWGDVHRVADRAFARLGMSATRQRNGVLFFIVPSAAALSSWGTRAFTQGSARSSGSRSRRRCRSTCARETSPWASSRASRRWANSSPGISRRPDYRHQRASGRDRPRRE